jgi:hypothetical protein
MTVDRLQNENHKAAKQNPALEALGAFVGVWQTLGKHPYFPDKTFHGKASFAWLEGGAFLIMRTNVDEPEIPDGIAIFGSDDARAECFMLYFDERGVSRKYDVQLVEDGIVWKRDDPAFSQRFTVTMASNRQTMRAQGEMSKNGGAWEPDLELAYTKVT